MSISGCRKEKTMSKLKLLVGVAALALTLIARASATASFSPAADATIKAAETLNLVEQAHGSHRSCRLGPVASSSRPLSSDGQTPQATCDFIEALRRARHTGKQIAAEVGVSPSTVSHVLKRRGLSRLSALELVELIRRYERANRVTLST
jgi:DNA-binding transcriptional ArsR family regulator